MDQPLLFLIKLAWACRYRLPLLITVGFMALDIRMQLEIHVQMRRIRRAGPPLPLRGGRSASDADQNTVERNNSDASSNSWLTIDGEESDPEERRLYLDSTEDITASTSRQTDLEEDSVSYQSLPEISDLILMHDSLLDVNVEN